MLDTFKAFVYKVWVSLACPLLGHLSIGTPTGVRCLRCEADLGGEAWVQVTGTDHPACSDASWDTPTDAVDLSKCPMCEHTEPEVVPVVKPRTVKEPKKAKDKKAHAVMIHAAPAKKRGRPRKNAKR